MDVDAILAHAGDVVNERTCTQKEKRDSLYVGRGTPWGNKYRIGEHGSRTNVVDLYRRDLRKMTLGERLAYLRPVIAAVQQGRKLRCYCAPELCHAMVLAGYARYYIERATTKR